MSKTLNETFLFRKHTEYEKMMLSAIMEGDTIDKQTDGFANILYEVKQRQVSSSLAKVLMSNKIILLLPNKPLPKSLKVFAAKDIKGDRQLKIFIDCSGVIFKNEKTGNYDTGAIDIFIACLVNAMTSLIYYADEKRIVMNNSVATLGAEAFSKLFTFDVNHLFKINSIDNVKSKCIYLSAMYYLVNILGREPDNESARSIAKKLAGISDREEEIIKYQLTTESFLNIKYFVESVAKVLRLDKLTLDLLLEKWMYIYGTGTIFALELFPHFAAMLTDTFVGCYINNQKTIEKVTDKSMVQFTKTILQIGADSV